MNCRDLEGSSSGLTQVFLDLPKGTEKKNTTHTVAVPDEIRTTGLTSASKQHTNPLGDTVQTGVVAHTDCPSDPYPTIASVATVSRMLTARSSANSSFCLTPFVQAVLPQPLLVHQIYCCLYLYSGVTQLSRSLCLLADGTNWATTCF